MTQNRNERTLKLVQIAMLAAIELIFAFTPIGYLHVGIIEVTFMTIPIAIAATTVGLAASVILSLIFGVTSFVQCFGMSAFGVLCLGISPWKTAVLCIVPRLLMGILTGYLFRDLKKTGKSLLAFSLTSLSAALFNTLFFVLTFFLLFRTASLDFGGGAVYDIGTMNLAQVFAFLAGFNGLVEVGVCTVLSTAIGKALERYLLPAIGKRTHTSGAAGADSDDAHNVVCPHCNATFRYHGEKGVCPYCGLDYPDGNGDAVTGADKEKNEEEKKEETEEKTEEKTEENKK